MEMNINEMTKNIDTIKEEITESIDESNNVKEKLIFKDREKSWLEFNARVISQISRFKYQKDLNIIDSLKFISIASNNLDEFIAVRFAEINDDPNYPSSNLESITNEIIRQRKSILDNYNSFNVNNNFDYKPDGDAKYHKKAKEIFNKEIFPILTPIMISNNKEIPRFNEKDINFLVKLNDNTNKSVYCLLQVPYQIERLYKIEKQFILSENLIEKFMSTIFNNSNIEGYIQFRAIKKYNKEIIHDEKESIVSRVNNVIQKREDNDIIFLEIKTYSKVKKSKSLCKYLLKLLKVDSNNVMIISDEKGKKIHLGLHYFTENVAEKIFKGNGTSIVPRYPKDLQQDTIFDYLDENDILIHRPYESFNVIIDFLKQAIKDPKTLSIKQTLYRVSSIKSPIVKLLCDAAMKGIKVTCVLELLARFDERNNINLIKFLKNAGVNIVYSLENYKTHAKMLIISKKSKKGISIYSHISTGNYNEKTATTYTDFDYFTSRNKIGRDLSILFNMITGFGNPEKLELLSYSPFNLNLTLIEEIEKVCNTSDAEHPGKVMIKVNAINDHDIISYIWNMAEKYPFVQFDIICRGICSLSPRKNIFIKSIVGFFLEHSRMYIFQSNNKSKVFISSADLLTRNLHKRIEILVPIQDKHIAKQLEEIFNTYYSDTANSWLLCQKEDYSDVEWIRETQSKSIPKEKLKNAHVELVKG